jgi:MFS family permease
VAKENKRLYLTLLNFAIFGISIQIFMPYLIIYYEKTLGLDNYVMIFAPAILLAAAITVFYGRLYDKRGFTFSIMPVCAMLAGGYAFLYFTRTTAPVFIGSLLMMSGYLTGMSIFGAMIRDNIPEGRAGQFQGVRIIGQVFVPGLIGPAIGARVLRDAEMITNSDGTQSFLPDAGIWSAAAAVLAVLVIALVLTMRGRGGAKNS